MRSATNAELPSAVVSKVDEVVMSPSYGGGRDEAMT